MDPMALLQYQFLMAKAAEYRAIAARQAMIANARLGGFPTFDPSSTTHLTNVEKVRLLQQMQAQQMLVQQARPEASHARLVQQPEPAPRAGSFDDSTVARVLQDLKEDSPTHSGDGARLDPDPEDEAAEACRAAREEQRAALLLRSHPAHQSAAHPRAYVKRHEFWARQAAESGGLDPSGFGPKVDGSNPLRAADTYASEIERVLGKRRRGAGDDECDGTDHSSGDDADGLINNLSRKGKSGRTEPDFDADLRMSSKVRSDDDAKDELAKEWAALTTWIRMNLHQPRTNKRKVLFVGHHPRLHPVPGAEAAIAESFAEGEATRWRGRLGPSGEVIGGGDSRGGGSNLGGGRKRAKVSAGDAHNGSGATRKGRIDGEDFVFVLNPEIDWSDVNIDTRVRMRTLVAETMDIFKRKYAKRKEHEWERKVQKYKPPGSRDGRTFNVPLGNVVRGIQETFYRHEPEARRAALERDEAGVAQLAAAANIPGTKQPKTPSPPREP